MIKYFFSILFLLFLITFFSSCDNTTEATNPDKYEIKGDPIAIDITIYPGSLQLEYSPNYSIDYSGLKLNGTELTTVKDYYPDPRWNLKVDREFVVAKNDSFRVEINNCNGEYEWLIDFGNMDLGDNNSWINSEVALLRTEKIINADSSVNYKFIFKALKDGKGYICFIERNSRGEISSVLFV
jgi:hypothetical protein